jgi:hypothetical protein
VFLQPLWRQSKLTVVLSKTFGINEKARFAIRIFHRPAEWSEGVSGDLKQIRWRGRGAQ